MGTAVLVRDHENEILAAEVHPQTVPEDRHTPPLIEHKESTGGRRPAHSEIRSLSQVGAVLEVIQDGHPDQLRVPLVVKNCDLRSHEVARRCEIRLDHLSGSIKPPRSVESVDLIEQGVALTPVMQ
ncbi:MULTISPECIES: hypothetical protein [unclassified Microbacterium]|uniref:hypothetical protein n=1 Tax=unclassified Microbacterium TaxID=2609290 RepID=UPI001604DEC3|nr:MULTISPECIES: hypothetical protein [unclassified Microbacterium]QNA93243.1 hypothetical protein G4G29_14655 [Microbacterium sp. Se63.02b]QYM63452.1 hypothetical protein K1X59_14705 [Microbacterium sp. Se5.02b]